MGKKRDRYIKCIVEKAYIKSGEKCNINVIKQISLELGKVKK